MSISQLLKHKLVLGTVFIGNNKIKKYPVTVSLSDKTFSSVDVSISGTMYAYHIHEAIFIGDDADAILWQIGAKFETTKSHPLLDTKTYITFAINEADRYG